LLLFSLTVVIAVLAYRQWLQPPLLAGWASYKAAFLSPDGRIVDNSNHGVSHSESQGYGLLFAFHGGDRESFHVIWQWTQKTLQVRQDHLFAWRHIPGEGVTDMNNASDGDMLIAWALMQAGEAWGEEQYLHEGRLILSDLRNSAIRQWQGETILLPGVVGFEHDGVYTVNLSYWLFPAFRDFQQFDPSPVWQALEQSGRRLIGLARYGEWRLPPDWLQLGETAQPASDHDPRYGYDAIRVPLNLVWGGVKEPALLQPFTHFYQSMSQRGERLPPWVDLTTNQLADYDAPAGIKAVYGLLDASQQKVQMAKADDYYSSSLMLMVELARQ
jgi:endoglucanase